MSILANILDYLSTNIRITLISIIIGFIAYKLLKFYIKVLSLPPGPIPLPVLDFRGTKQHWTQELEKVGDKYGPVFTLWTGTFPVVFISDIDIARDVFRRNDFAGRPDTVFSQLFRQGESGDIATADFGPKWEALKRVAHSALQKYSSNDKLDYLVSDCVDYTIETMVEKEGFNKPFSPFGYIYNIYLNILATSAFGIRYDVNDQEYKMIKYVNRDIFIEIGYRFLFWEMFPILTKIDKKVFNKLKKHFEELINLIKNKFKSHYEDYDESDIRDFCDTLISAKNDALRDGKKWAPYLTETNLALVIMDIFVAGTDTSQTTFRWILFLMKYFPEVENKLRKEIETQIGDRIPTQEDRHRCHYVMAVISETLRLKNVTPQGVNHKAVVTSKIGDYTIVKGTQLVAFQGHILHKEEYWKNAKEFRPERFLENGKYITTRLKAFIPFGVGRRFCLGEKMAMINSFLVLVRFIQKTADYKLNFHYSGGNDEGSPHIPLEYHPKSYKISLQNNKLI